MNYLQDISVSQLFRPLDANGVTVTAIAIDSCGPSGFNKYNYLTCILVVGNIAADSTALAMQHCDTSGGSYATPSITSSLAFTGADLPLATGGDNGTWLWQINLGAGYKRYWKMLFTAGAGATLCAGISILSRSNRLPLDITEQGVTKRIVA